tara:strand:- start:840 stop:1124 length:285 start_codon:yes stop_codon:yes gene_type:complete
MSKHTYAVFLNTQYLDGATYIRHLAIHATAKDGAPLPHLACSKIETGEQYLAVEMLEPNGERINLLLPHYAVSSVLVLEKGQQIPPGFLAQNSP